MKRIPVVVFLCLAIAGVHPEADRSQAAPGSIVGTNLAYLTLTAISTNANNVFLVLPLEIQLSLDAYFSLNPALTFIYSDNAASSTAGMLVLGECAIAYHPEGRGLRGWSLGLSPGVAYSLDSRRAGLVVSAEAGYQWILGKGLFLGLSGGGKFIYMDGSLWMPDLKLRAGWAL